MKSPNLTMMKLAALAALTATPLADAGAGTGTHGGDVVACFKGNMADTIAARAKKYKQDGSQRDPIQDDGIAALIGKPELLDLFTIRRTKSLDGTVETLTPGPKNYLNGIQDTDTRVKNVNYPLWERYLTPGTVDLPLSHFKTVPTGVVSVDDAKEIGLLAKNCLLLQIAVQETVGKEVFVKADERLFKRMPALDQTALFSHERFLRMTSLEGDTDSNRAREINGIVYLSAFGSDHAKAFVDRLSPLVKDYPATSCPTESNCVYQGVSLGGAYARVLDTNGTGYRLRTAGTTYGGRRIEYPTPVEFMGYWFKTIAWANEDSIGTIPETGELDNEKSKMPAWAKELKLTAQFSIKDGSLTVSLIRSDLLKRYSHFEPRTAPTDPDRGLALSVDPARDTYGFYLQVSFVPRAAEFTIEEVLTDSYGSSHDPKDYYPYLSANLNGKTEIPDCRKLVLRSEADDSISYVSSQ